MVRAAFAGLVPVVIVGSVFFAHDAAAVFRCTVGGKTTYSDMPCQNEASGGRVRLYSGGPSEEDATRAQARLDQLKADSAALKARQEAEREAGANYQLNKIYAEREAKRNLCAELIAKKKDAEYWAAEFRHPDNIAREQGKAAHAEDRLWWDCQKVD